MICFVFNLSTTALLTYIVSLFRTFLTYPSAASDHWGLHEVMQWRGVQMGYTGGTMRVQWGYSRGTVRVQ